MSDHLFLVIPAKAGIQSDGGTCGLWTPAFAGVTKGSAGMTKGCVVPTSLGKYRV